MAGETERVFPAAPIIVGGGRILPAPSSFYLTGADRLRLVSANSKTGVTLQLHWRLADPRGEIVANRVDHTPNTDRTVKTTDHELGSGQLLNATVFANGGSPQIGQTYVMVQLVRGIGSAAIVLGTLLGGHVTGTQALGFPGSPIESSIAGGGAFRSITGTQPGVGSAIVETVPTGARWELRCVSLVATISAAGVARPVMLQFRDSSAVIIGGAITPVTMLNVGGQRIIFSANFNAPTNQTPDASYPNYAGLPYPLVLQAGGSFTVPNPTGSDTYAAPQYEVLEWLEP